ncbi:MAG: hypothetical protein HYS13_16670 [Planctomycetia bacterium]|nr:hypothetical protein [Planctomycetia bacterium]
MTRVTIDDSLCAKLDGVSGPVELCDNSGRVVGKFLPSGEPATLWPQDECPYTEEELEAMRKTKGGRTLAEIWKSLGRT